MDFENCEVIIISNESDPEDDNHCLPAPKIEIAAHMMDHNYEERVFSITPQEFPIICRTCFSKGELLPIRETLVRDIKVSELLKECVSIQVKENDTLPPNICKECVTKVLDIYSFKKQCDVNESTLKLMLINSLTAKCEKLTEEKERVKTKSPTNTGRTKNEENSKTIKQVKNEQSENLKEDDITNIDGDVSIESNDSADDDCDDNDDPGGGDDDVFNISSDKRTKVKKIAKHKGTDNSSDSIDSDEIKPDVRGNGYVENSEFCLKTEKTESEEQSVIKCRDCEETFDDKESLRLHRIAARHPVRKNRECDICNKKFASGKLKQHMRTHTKEKPFVCRFCKLSFSIRGNLKRHMMRHTGERPHMCEYCGKGFIQSTSLHNHKRTHTRDNINPGNPDDPCYNCEFCGRDFKRLGPFKIHMTKHNAENGAIIVEPRGYKGQQEDDKSYMCEVCNKGFTTKGLLKGHQVIHGEKSFLCSFCGKGFVTKASLQSHFRTHTGERPYLCTHCNKSFSHVGSYDTHLLIHKGLRPHACKICGRRFTQVSHVMYHMRTHSGERPYKCTYCGKTFALKGNLTVHIRMHTGETPYSCEHCGKGFYDSSSRNKHQRSHEHEIKVGGNWIYKEDQRKLRKYGIHQKKSYICKNDGGQVGSVSGNIEEMVLKDDCFQVPLQTTATIGTDWMAS